MYNFDVLGRWYHEVVEGCKQSWKVINIHERNNGNFVRYCQNLTKLHKQNNRRMKQKVTIKWWHDAGDDEYGMKQNQFQLIAEKICVKSVSNR